MFSPNKTTKRPGLTLNLGSNNINVVPTLVLPENNNNAVPTLVLPENNNNAVPTLALPGNNNNDPPKLALFGNNNASPTAREAAMVKIPIVNLSDDERQHLLNELRICNEINPLTLSICGGNVEEYERIRKRSPQQADFLLKRWVAVYKILKQNRGETPNFQPKPKNLSLPYNYVIKPKNNLTLKTKKYKLRDLFLCNQVSTRRSRNKNSKITAVISPQKNSSSSGSYGEVKSKEIVMRGLDGDFSCLSAIKEQKRDIILGPYELIIGTGINELGICTELIDTPGIAQTTHAKLTQNSINLAMEYYGKNLVKLFDEDIPKIVRNGETSGPLEPSKEELFIKAIMYQIINAVASIHKKSIIHLDIKPANILLTYDARIVIADFGSALHVVKGFHKLQSAYLFRTWKAICSPESIIRRNYNNKFDVWGLGCCLTYLCTNLYPLNDEDISRGLNDMALEENSYTQQIDIIKQQIKDKYPDSTNLLGFLDSALELDPSKRPEAIDLLRTPWLADITSLEQSRQIIQDTLWNGKYGLISSKLILNSYKNKEKIKEKEIRTRTIYYKTGDKNTKKIVNYSQYFLLKKTPDWKISILDQHTKVTNLNILFDKLLNEKSHPKPLQIQDCLHAIELLDRFAQKKNVTNFGKDIHTLSYLFVRLAIYMSPYNTSFRMKNPKFIKRYIKFENDIIKSLSGDLVPKKTGLTSLVMNTLDFNPRSFIGFLILYSIKQYTIKSNTTTELRTIISEANAFGQGEPNRAITDSLTSFPRANALLQSGNFAFLQANINNMPKV